MEIESFRITPFLSSLLMGACNEMKVSKSDFLRRCLLDGLKNQKLNEELKERLKFAELDEQFKQGKYKIQVTLKKASLVDNYERLLRQTRSKKVSREHYNEVRNTVLERIKKIFGEQSKEYKYCFKRNEW